MTSRKEISWTVRGRRITEVRMAEHKDAHLARVIWSFRDRNYPVEDVTINGVPFDASGEPLGA